MANYVKVVVYVRSPEAEKLRGHGITDIPSWTRNLVKDSILGMKDPPARKPDPDTPEDPLAG